MNIGNLSEHSDSSDEDYIPEASNAELPSEEDSEGDIEDVLPVSGNTSTNKGSRRAAKTRKKQKNTSPLTVKKIVVDKQSTDDLWADFKKDTGFKTRAERQLPKESSGSTMATTSVNECDESQLKTKPSEMPKPVKVTEVYKFAGEEIKVEKDVSIPSGSNMSLKRGAKTGINSILSNIGKKSKINTLEKSKLDWDTFKREENIEDELQAYGKSKDGYLERQDFLQRADLRRFEIEKDIRSTLRTNRMNN